MALTSTLLVPITALVCLHCIAHLASSSTSGFQKIEPPVYVIKDEPQQSSNEALTRQWNNQKLTLRKSTAANGGARLAKQVFYSDEPTPYYHSYKYLGQSAVNHQFRQVQYQHPQLPVAAMRDELQTNELPWYRIQPYVSHKRHGPAYVAAGTKTTKTRRVGATKGRPANRKFAPAPQPEPELEQHFPILPEMARSPKPANGTSVRSPSRKKKNLVCYYGTWAVYRPDAGRYPVENIDPFLCTHIIYGFTGLSYDSLIKPLDPWNDLEDNYGKGAMKRFTNLKRINPDLKTLVAIGGWNEGSIKYSKMASEPEARARFVQSVVEFLARYNFDGLDLDWEYPGSRGGFSYDKQNFVTLLRELKQAFAPHGYLLTAAVSAGKWFVDPAYDIPQVSKYLDLINLMAYDYHGGWETKTGMNAPLFHSKVHDLGKDEALLNVNWSVNYWLQQGASAEKIMLGVGSYGRSFTLDKPQVNGINAPASQKGQAGPYTREPGSLGYNEICESFQRSPEQWTIVRDPDYLAPYAYSGRQWVGYDDMQSLALKAQYAKSMGLGGMMMWSIETDDFQGRCHGEKYPLLNTIKRVLGGGDGGVVVPKPEATTRRPSGVSSTSRRPVSVSSTTPSGEVEEEERPAPSSSTTRRPPASTSRRPPTQTSTRRPQPVAPATSSTRRPDVPRPPASSSRPRPTTSTTTQAPARPQPSAEFVCRADGMFADPRNCRKFIRCVSAGGGANYSLFRFDCGPGTAFNEQQQYCDHIYNVPNCSNSNNNAGRLLYSSRANDWQQVIQRVSEF